MSEEAGGLITRGAPRIGRYAVLELLGEGAMGRVYAVYDEQLDRRVALKLVKTAGIGHARERMLREAQAMAKLSHPNVVPVFEVGEHEGELFVAMEYVEGVTLAQWRNENERSWSEVVDKYLQAGRGLQAAHAEGLVHRDFKPHNAVVGRDGRVRVLDFGLAALAAESSGTGPESTSEPRPRSDGLHAALTESGTVMGTPAYMSPEQFLGDVVDPRSDQFSFCVALWEAVYGERPFQAPTRIALLDAITRGEINEPRNTAVPLRLRRALERGLRAERDERWPELEALLALLARLHVDVARRRRSRAIVAAVAIAVVAPVVVVPRWQAWDAAQRSDGCRDAAAQEIAEVWNDAARERTHAGLLGIEVAYAQASADSTRSWLDQHATAWQAARAKTCIAGEVEGEYDDRMRERVASCLHEHKLALSALVDELGEPDDDVVRTAVSAAAGLPRADACVDTTLLARVPDVPSDARDTVEHARERLAHARALGHTAQFSAALDEAREALTLAQEIGWAPLVADAQLVLGRMLFNTGDIEGSARTVEDAFFTAAHAGNLETVGAAATELIWLLGNIQYKEADARRWARHADVAFAALGIGEDDMRRVRYLSKLGLVEYRANHIEAAERLHARALAAAETVFGADHPDNAALITNLASAYLAKGERARALALNERALALREQALGPDHPLVAESLNNLAGALLLGGEFVRAKELLERALTIKRAAVGPRHADVARGLAMLGGVHGYLGETERARTLLEEAVAIAEDALGPHHPELGMMSHDLAVQLVAPDELDRKRSLHERALAIFRPLPGQEDKVAEELTGLANVAQRRGDHEQALARFTEALEIREKLHGPEDPMVAASLSNLAIQLQATGEHARALPLLERAVSIFGMDNRVGSGDAMVVALNEEMTRFAFALSLVATGGDRARAIAEAETAASMLREFGPGRANDLATVEAWLAGERTESPSTP